VHGKLVPKRASREKLGKTGIILKSKSCVSLKAETGTVTKRNGLAKDYYFT